MKVSELLKKISIIVPVYNNINHIKKCIESIINQSYRNIEILIVDDGSTDKSIIICEEYSKRDSRIRIISQENQGVSAARNTGLRNAIGDYIGFVDSDDYIEKDMYENLIIAANKHDADIVETGVYLTDENENILRTTKFKENMLYNKYDCVTSFLSGDNTANYVWNKIFKQSLVKDVTFPNYKYSEDYYFNYMLHARCNIKVTLPLLDYYYVQQKNSVTNVSFNKNKMDTIIVGKMVLESTVNHYTKLSPFVANYLLGHLMSLYFQIENEKSNKNSDYKQHIIREYNELYDKWNNNVFSLSKIEVIKKLFRFNPYMIYIMKNMSDLVR